MCGILDNLGNKLCYPENENCPLNYITTNKSDSNYSITGSAKLTKNKEIYFSNKATENGTIVGGLFVDSDLLIKYNDEDCETLEEGTVRQLLDSHPYKLYKKSLSYDPYKKKTNEVENGKSYLKWCVPGVGKEKNISKIKELNIEFDYNVTSNLLIIEPIKISTTESYFVSLPGYIGLLFLLIVFIFTFFEINEIPSRVPGCYGCQKYYRCYRCKKNWTCYNPIKLLIFLVFVATFVLLIVGTALAFANISNISAGNDLNLDSNIITSLKSLNITIICFNIILFIFMIVFSVYLGITPQKAPVQETITQYETHKDKNNNTNGGSSDFKSSNDDYYNSSDFRINNDDDYYNSSDYKNNLLVDKPQQPYSGLDNNVGFTYQ